MARDCKKCKHFRVMHPNYNDSFAYELDPYCSWMEYKDVIGERIKDLIDG